MPTISFRELERFGDRLRREGLSLPRTPLETLQINVGKFCNQACHHCHVEAGPLRTEKMERGTAERLLTLIASYPALKTVDITGGAPELNPHFRLLVREARRLGKRVIDRCNLTVLFQPGQEDTAEFLGAQQVVIIASLPCYTAENVDAQRGVGVFAKSIDALRLLNTLGYGQADSGLELNLIYNPLGPFLPPAQAELEQDYRQELRAQFGIAFNHLYTLTNMPIHRFRHELERTGQLEAYVTLLAQNFNGQAAQGVMWRNLISVGWDGQLYDCDFNQMLEIPAGGRQRKTIWEISNLVELEREEIAFDDHCYGCTAGAGSSCGGALLASRA
jgi:radical SAM/Cys-rich protein